MVEIVGPPRNATRNKPIAPELRAVLEGAAREAGIERIRITSGGQDALGEGPNRLGSTRHDRGRAADLKLVVKGRVLTFTDRGAPPPVLAFVTACAALGATGIGAGEEYMGPETLHVGFGRSLADRQRLVWGKKGASAAAPAWLVNAAAAGWARAGRAGPAPLDPTPPREQRIVIARGGLWLRKGPGLHFDRSRLLAAGVEVSIVGYDGPNGEWARVDLENDGFVDGHVFAAFLAPAENSLAEEIEEPQDAISDDDTTS